MAASATYTSPFVLEYAYKRSLGPVLSRFYTGLRDGVLLGAQTASGRVLAPPTEYDPDTGEDIRDLIEIGPGGVVVSWTWCDRPPAGCPLDAPFAWALVRLDGADTAMLHAVVTDSPEALRAGARVTVQWAEQRQGGLWDLTFRTEGS